MRPLSSHHTPSIITTLLLALSALSALTSAQNAAAGGGGPEASYTPVQYPTVVPGPRLTVIGGATTTLQEPFTQTFVLPLATWAFPTPMVGSIGLGTIQGQIGTARGG